MFFRREKPHAATFEEHLAAARAAGLTVQAEQGSRVRLSRDGCTCLVENTPEGPRVIEKPGLAMGNETGALVDRGFQKFFTAPSGRSQSAKAAHLKSLHSFQEDLREALGLASLYNESLGTVSKFYAYDRVENRDAGVPKRAWEK
jgi:hypothetical protein